MAGTGVRPGIGIGFRPAIRDWTLAHLDRFDVLEITVDHCIFGGPSVRGSIYGLVGRIPLTAHGIGLSIGTDTPLDMAYLDTIAGIVERLGAPCYSEHLAFTKVPGLDLANLLPVPKTEAVAERIIEKIRIVRSHIAVPFYLENISYFFDWPDSVLSDAEFFNLIRQETEVGLLLDVENLFVNSRNFNFDPYTFLDALPSGAVESVHAAGGVTVREDFLDGPILADSHSHPVPDEALDLLDYALERQFPATIILERDDRLHRTDEILSDVARIRRRLVNPRHGEQNVEPASVGSPD